MREEKDCHLTRSCHFCPIEKESIFSNLSSEDAQALECQKNVSAYHKGQNLFVEGSFVFGIYCLSKGNVKLTKLDHQGKEVILKLAKAGDLLGRSSLFDDSPSSYTATAIDDVTICFISKKTFIHLMEKNSSLAMSYLKRLSKNLSELEEGLYHSYSHNVLERLAALILELKEGRGEEVSPGRFRLNIRLSREEMASMIGTSSETLIRFMSMLREEEILSQEGKVMFIEKLDKLEEIFHH